MIRALALTLLLAGCATTGDTTATRTQLSAQMIWMDDPAPTCLALGVAPPATGRTRTGCHVTIKGQTYIVMPMPRDFYDDERICILGHEAWHDLGARHQ